MPPPCRTQYDEVCRERFDQLCGKLDRIDVAIRGNGADRPGIGIRLDRLEGSEGRRSRLLWLIAATTATLAISQAWNFLWTKLAG